MQMPRIPCMQCLQISFDVSKPVTFDNSAIFSSLLGFL